MKKHSFISRLLLLMLALVLVATTALAVTSCGKQTENPAPADTEVADNDAKLSSAEELGIGSTDFWFQAVMTDGTTKNFHIFTDETTVGAALVALELVSGETSQYGLYVKTVCGETVDYDTDGKYWAFYIGNDYAMTGVDGTDIVAGTVYSFKVE